MELDEGSYRAFFQRTNRGNEPYGFQIDVARRLVAGDNIVLPAPTGSGKTATVLTPFLFPGWAPRPARLIYTLPLRTLAQSVYRTAREMAAASGEGPDQVVTIQTGEQPDDPFFDRGTIIIATYDQVLSGLLDNPYGLSGRLHNVNAAAVAGALVIFDEFHLMEPQRAFLTGAAGLHLFREVAQCVWMTATATGPLIDTLAQSVNAVVLGPSDADVATLPSVRAVSRSLVWEPAPLETSIGDQIHHSRTIVITNRVARAQELYRVVRSARPDIPTILLHSRFFRSDRKDKEEELQRRFGPRTKGPAILIATQVIEAGVDISCDHLHSDVAPMNSVIQRSGRCARFPGEVGVVHIHPLPQEDRSWLPYGSLQGADPALESTIQLLRSRCVEPVGMTPAVAAQWVEAVHGEQDRQALGSGWKTRLGQIRHRVYQSAVLRQPTQVGELIREPDTDDIQIILVRPDNLPMHPVQREAIKLNRWRLGRICRQAAGQKGTAGWLWQLGDNPSWQLWKDPAELSGTYAVAIDPAFAKYSSEVGLEEGYRGVIESPPRVEPPRPGYAPLKAEAWAAHAKGVAREAVSRLCRDDNGGWLSKAFARRYGIGHSALLEAVRASGLTHDLGKLQMGWQEWAAQSQASRFPEYRHSEALAHTDYDASSLRDHEAEKRIAVRRPDHSTASAFLAASLFGRLLGSLPGDLNVQLASASVGAVLAHHGGWLQSEAAQQQDLGIQPMWPGSAASLDGLFGAGTLDSLAHLLESDPDARRRILIGLLERTIGDAVFLQWWPLVAYLTRTLRLADQRATAEGGSD